MTADKRNSWEIARWEHEWKREFDKISLRSKRELDDRRREANRELDRQIANARQTFDRARADVSGRIDAGGRGGRGWSRDRALADWQSPDNAMLAGAIPFAILALLTLAVGHVTALLTSGEWPRYELADAPGILGRIVGNPGHPGAAWDPVNTGGDVPGPIAWWATFVVLGGLIGALALLVLGYIRAPAPGATGAGWAKTSDVRSLRVGRLPGRRREGHRLVVGTSGHDRIALRNRHSLLVVGPAFSGKTSGVTIPALLEWPGPAIVVSSKGHLIDQTIGWRSHLGDVHVYDPAATTSYPRSGWSLLADCASWPGAIRAARDLTVAAKASVGNRVDAADLDGIGGDALWSSSMAMTLAPYLLAAVVSGRSVGTAAGWIAREERDEVLEVLRPIGGPPLRTHENSFVRPDPDRSAFLHLMHRILSVYEDPVVAASMDRHEIVPTELLDGGQTTLYLTAPEHDQARFRPLSATILRQVLVAAYDRSAAWAGPIDPPLLLLLDQVVGIAPIDDLAALASTGAARGVQIVSVFKDLAQIDGHYGGKARLLVNNHPAKLVMPRGTDITDSEDDLLPHALDSQLADSEAALLYGNRPPMRLQLRPWFRVKELRRRRETPQERWDPADHAHGGGPTFASQEQTSAWLRRGPQGATAAPSDPSIPGDTTSPEYTSIFGSIHEDDTGPINVTPLSDARRKPFRQDG